MKNNSVRVDKFRDFLDIVDEEFGIGLGLDYSKINESNIDNLKHEFVEKFTRDYNFIELLGSINESNNKSFMEILNDI